MTKEEMQKNGYAKSFTDCYNFLQKNLDAPQRTSQGWTDLVKEMDVVLNSVDGTPADKLHRDIISAIFGELIRKDKGRGARISLSINMDSKGETL